MSDATAEDLLAIERLIGSLSADQRHELTRIAKHQAKAWMPNPGPQTKAYYCEVLLPVACCYEAYTYHYLSGCPMVVC